jgi:hypothetical protein
MLQRLGLAAMQIRKAGHSRFYFLRTLYFPTIDVEPIERVLCSMTYSTFCREKKVGSATGNRFELAPNFPIIVPKWSFVNKLTGGDKVETRSWNGKI